MRVRIRWISRIIFSLTAPMEDLAVEDLAARRRSSRASSRSLAVIREAMTLEFWAL